MSDRVSDERLRGIVTAEEWEIFPCTTTRVVAAELLDARDRIARALKEAGRMYCDCIDGYPTCPVHNIRAILTGDES